MKKIKLLIFILIAVCVVNINTVYGEKNKFEKKITNAVIAKKENNFVVFQGNKLKHNYFATNCKNNYSMDDDSEHTNLNNYEIKDIRENTITIPNVCRTAIITEGSTQRMVDRYDVCLMTEAAAIPGGGQPVLLGGHNTKSLKYLHNSKIGDVISVNYLGNCYQYKVIYSNECATDNYNLFDIDNGKNVLEYKTGKEVLQIYTCYGNKNRWLVKAEKI